MLFDKSIFVTLTLSGFLVLLASYLITIILLVIFNRKVFALDQSLYSHLKLEKFFFLWGKEYKQFVFEKGYLSCKHTAIFQLSKTLDKVARIGTMGFVIGVILGLSDIVTSELL